MPKEVPVNEWADFLAAHKCYAREPHVNAMEHVDNVTGKVLGRVEYSEPKKYFIYPEASDMNGYVCLYEGKRYEVWAKSQLQAKELAVVKFRPPKSKRHMISVMLAEKGGQPVTHSTNSIG